MQAAKRANQAKELEQFLPQEALQAPGNGFLYSCKIEISQFLPQTMVKTEGRKEGVTHSVPIDVLPAFPQGNSLHNSGAGTQERKEICD